MISIIKFKFLRRTLQLEWKDGWTTSDGSHYLDIESAARMECICCLKHDHKCPSEHQKQIAKAAVDARSKALASILRR